MSLSVVASQRKEIKRLSDINAELLEALQEILRDNMVVHSQRIKANSIIARALGG